VIAVSAVSAAGGVLLLDLALLALLLAVVVLKMQNTRPDRASPTGCSNEVAAPHQNITKQPERILIMTKSTRATMKARQRLSEPIATPSLHDVLLALGFYQVEIVSTLGKPPSGSPLANLMTVDEYRSTGFTPPADYDVWFGVNPISPDVVFGRGTELDVTRVVAIFADLDVKAGGLASLTECHEVVKHLSNMLRVPPAVVVESGHGLQPYWRIVWGDTTLRVAADNRQAWRDIYARWGGLVQQVAQEVNPAARIDNVYQLSHVMRCPGSVNNKADPIAVRTTLVDGALPLAARTVTRKHLQETLDLYEAPPLGGEVGPLAKRVPTSWGEAVDWINAQPGTNEPIRSMSALMFAHCDFDAVVKQFEEGVLDEGSAYSLMTKKVWSAVALSTEGNTGLALAVATLHAAYLEVVTVRRKGQLRKESRSPVTAEDEFRRCLVGAVAKVRARGNSPLPSRDANGKIQLLVTREAGK